MNIDNIYSYMINFVSINKIIYEIIFANIRSDLWPERFYHKAQFVTIGEYDK